MNVPAAAACAVGGWASASLANRFGDRAVPLAAVVLAGMPLIYPAARRDFRPDARLATEAAVSGAAVAVAVLGAHSPRGRTIVAVGWAAHAVFDLLVGPSEDSRLPDWYAEGCAAYDLAYAARFLR